MAPSSLSFRSPRPYLLLLFSSSAVHSPIRVLPPIARFMSPYHPLCVGLARGRWYVSNVCCRESGEGLSIFLLHTLGEEKSCIVGFAAVLLFTAGLYTFYLFPPIISALASANL